MTPPDNGPLTRAINALFEAPATDAGRYFRPVLEALVAGTLIGGAGDDPLTAEGDEGEELLALFTDLIELHMFEPGAAWAPIPGERAIRSVAEGDFDGLVVNPRGRSFELSREDVSELFEVDDL